MGRMVVSFGYCRVKVLLCWLLRSVSDWWFRVFGLRFLNGSGLRMVGMFFYLVSDCGLGKRIRRLRGKVVWVVIVVLVIVVVVVVILLVVVVR